MLGTEELAPDELEEIKNSFNEAGIEIEPQWTPLQTRVLFYRLKKISYSQIKQKCSVLKYDTHIVNLLTRTAYGFWYRQPYQIEQPAKYISEVDEEELTSLIREAATTRSSLDTKSRLIDFIVEHILCF